MRIVKRDFADLTAVACVVRLDRPAHARDVLRFVANSLPTSLPALRSWSVERRPGLRSKATYLRVVRRALSVVVSAPVVETKPVAPPAPAEPRRSRAKQAA